MNKQKQYFINGLVLVIIAILAVTILPYSADKLHIIIEKDTFSEFEFFTLTAGTLFYLFSPKYYKMQILSIVFAALSYYLFLKIYPFL